MTKYKFQTFLQTSLSLLCIKIDNSFKTTPVQNYTGFRNVNLRINTYSSFIRRVSSRSMWCFTYWTTAKCFPTSALQYIEQNANNNLRSPSRSLRGDFRWVTQRLVPTKLMWVHSFAVEDVLLQGLLWYRQSISNQDRGFTKSMLNSMLNNKIFSHDFWLAGGCANQMPGLKIFVS